MELPVCKEGWCGQWKEDQSHAYVTDGKIHDKEFRRFQKGSFPVGNP